MNNLNTTANAAANTTISNKDVECLHFWNSFNILTWDMDAMSMYVLTMIPGKDLPMKFRDHFEVFMPDDDGTFRNESGVHVGDENITKNLTMEEAHRVLAKVHNNNNGEAPQEDAGFSIVVVHESEEGLQVPTTIDDATSPCDDQAQEEQEKLVVPRRSARLAAKREHQATCKLRSEPCFGSIVIHGLRRSARLFSRTLHHH